jgi:signal transduction histidine kinase
MQHTAATYFDLIINQNPDLICRYSLDKKIEFINETIYKVAGRTPDFYINKSIRDFGYPPIFLEQFESGFDNCVSQGTPTVVEIAVTEGHLANTHFIINFIPIIAQATHDNTIIGIFSVSRNVTKEKKLEISQQEKIVELEILCKRVINKANKLQNFAHIVSHNLRSPLANIVGLINLYDSAQIEQERFEFFEHIKLSVDRLSQTVEDLTEVVRINQNFEVKVEKLRFQDILQHILESIYITVAETRTYIECDFTACEEIMYNKVYLESIFLNLITNAIKYRSHERVPVVKLKTYQEQDTIILTCEDNGVGINMQRYGHKIFGLHKTFHGNQDARGVGLYITKNQIEALGGRIDVQSEEGQGTIFTIHFYSLT